MNWKRTIQKTGKWAALTLAALLLLVATLFGLAQTNPGKRQLVKLITRTLVSGEQKRIELGELSGLIPFTFHLETMTLGDAEGPWMRAESLVLRWSPFALLRREIVIHEFSARRVSLERLPRTKGTPTGPSMKKLRTWPRALFGLRVERFLIHRFALGDAWLGQAALFRIDAKLRAESHGGVQETRISVERLDGPKMGLQIHAMLHHAGSFLNLDAALEEAQNGLAAAALGIPGPLALSVRGEGPVRDWKGIFRADFPHVGQCESQIQIHAGKPFAMNVQGTLSFSPGFLPEPMAAWIDRDPRFSVSGRFPKPDLLDLERMTVETGDVVLHLAGSLDLKRNRSKGQFTLIGKDLKPLSSLIKGPSAGSFKAEGSVSGPLFQPEAEVRLTTWNSAFHRLSFSTLDGTFSLKFLEPLTSGLPKFRVRGKGMVKGITLQDSKLPPQEEIQWQLGMENPGENVFLIKEAKAKTEGIDLTLTGRINPWASQGELDVVLHVAKPSVLVGFFGLKLPETGRTSLSTSLKGNLNKGSFAAQFRGKTRILDQRLGATLGEQIEYRGHMALEGAKRLMLSDFIAEASPGTLSVKGAYDLGGKTVNASWTMSVPKLVALSPILKYPMEGSVRMGGTLEGPLSEITLSLQGTAENFFIEGFRLGDTTATLRAHGFPPKSDGRLDLQIRPNGQPINIKASYALQGDTLALNSIFLEGARTRLDGTATLAISKMFSQGELKGRSDDLSVLAALFGGKIQGSAKGTVSFKLGKSDQEITLALEARHLKTPVVDADHAGLQAHIQNLFKSPKGSATIEIKDARLQEFAFSSSKLTAEGALKQIAFTVTTTGRHRENFDLEGSGLFASSPRGQMIALNRLKARYGELPLELAGPFQILLSHNAVALNPFAVKIGSGGLDGKGQLERNALALDLAFRNMSLKAFRYFGFRSLKGTAEGALHVQGSPQHPAGNLRMRVNELKLDVPQFADFPPGVLDIKAQLEQKRIRGEASLQRLTAEPFRATLDLPVNLALWPFAFSLPQQEEIKGHLDGAVDLARIAPLFGLDDQEMTGQMDLDLSLGGRAKNPEVKGQVTVHKGTYESLRTGTILKNMDVEIAASGHRLTIERARASDGDKGIITAKGWLDMLPYEGYPFQVDLTLEHAKLFRHDAASGTAGGQLTFEGSLVESALKGKLLVESAEFRIPERLPPEAADLEVIEIHREGIIAEVSDEKKVPKSGIFKLDLSLSSPGRAFLRGRGLDSEWQGELKITGTADEPIMTGNLGIVRGRFNFLGKRFDLARGVISFQGMTPPSPILDVLGEARTKDITASIGLSGSLQAPELTLSSEPSLPTDEILSRLLFGRSVTQITPLQALQLANAVNTLAGGGGMDFVGRTREVLKLDQLEIKQSGSKPEDAAVSAGKYISDTVFLEVEQGLGPDSGKASVQWEMTPNITVETEAGVNAEGGAGISWKWDY